MGREGKGRRRLDSCASGYGKAAAVVNAVMNLWVHNLPAFRNKQTAQVSAVMSQRREVSAMLTLRSSFGTLADVSVNTSFSDTKSKAAKIIKRSNKFRNRNALRKVQRAVLPVQGTDSSVANAKWLRHSNDIRGGTHTW
jgi:hypothetical protein